MKTKNFLEIQQKGVNTIRARKKCSGPRKSDHAHIYSDCLLLTKEKITSTTEVSVAYLAKYCIICGKISGIQFFETEKCGDHESVILSNKANEVLLRHPGLEQFEVLDIWKDKYVKISEKITHENR